MLRFLDSFGLTDYNHASLKYTYVSTFDQGDITDGPTSGNPHALYIVNTAFADANYTRIFEPQSEWTVGFHYRPRNASGLQTWTAVQFLRIGDGTQTLFALAVNSSGHLEAYNAGVTLIGTSVEVFPVGSFRHLELKITFGPHGSYELRRALPGEVTGTKILGDDNIALGAPSHYAPDRVTFRYQGFFGTGINIANYFILDGQAGLRGFLGPCEVDALYPVSATVDQWSHSGAADAWTATADRAGFHGAGGYPDDDSTFISPSSTPSLELFLLVRPNCYGLIYGIAGNAVSRKVSGALQRQTIKCRQASVLRNFGTEFDLDSTSYKVYQHVSENSLATGHAWSDGEIGSAEWGLTNGVQFPDQRTTQFYIEKLVSLNPSKPFNCGPGSYSF